MNLTDLSYFLLVAEECSFTRAAQKLYISQQALSSRIARLETRPPCLSGASLCG